MLVELIDQSNWMIGTLEHGERVIMPAGHVLRFHRVR